MAWCLLVAALVSSVGLARPSKRGRAATRKVPGWVAIAVADEGVPAGWADALREVALKTTVIERTWVDSPTLGREEMQLTASCPSWGPACAGKVAGLLGGDNALLISLSRDPTGVVVRIDSMDTAGAVVGDPERVVVDADDGGLSIAKAWVEGALRGARPTVLVITSDLPDTEVKLDGVRRGGTPLTLVDGLEPGEHLLVFSREGRAPLARTIVVQPGTLNREHGVLASGGPKMNTTPSIGVGPPEPLPEVDEAHAPLLAVAGFSAAGVGAVTGLGALLFAANRAGLRDALFDGGQMKLNLCAFDDGTYAPCETRTGGEPVDNSDRKQRVLPFADDMFQQTQIGLAVAGVGAVLVVGGLAAGVMGLMHSPEEADAALAAPSPGDPAPASTTPPASAR